MPLAPQAQNYQFKYQVPQGLWRWTTRLDTSGTTPICSILDILSPFGLLRDGVSIPGAVAQAMATSITELQTAFAPAILTAPTSLSFVVDEGRGWSEGQDVTLTNVGTYGSLLSTTLTTSASYVKTSPTRVGGLAINGTGQASVTVDSTDLLATESPYAATVVIQDPNATNTPSTVSLAVTVRPKAHIELDPTELVFTAVKPVSGPYDPIPVQTFEISNAGPTGSVLAFQVAKLLGNSPWLVSYSPGTGSLVSSGTQNVTVAVEPPEGLLAGTYSDTLRVSGYSDNYCVDIPVTLIVT